MKTKDLPKITAGQVLGSDGLLSDTAGRGTALLTLDEAMKFLDGKRGYHINPNLLINGDFRKPVNRNGQSEYSGNIWSIDKWEIENGTVKVMNGYLEITLNAQYSEFIFKPSHSEVGKKYVLSWFLDLITAGGKIYTQIYTDTLDGYNWTSRTGLQILSGAATIDSNIAMVSIVNSITTPVTFKLYAAKLELGNQQTLAHKDADGNWVLNEPPNYDLQYALCSQYSPSTGDFVGNQHSNENLLDNWYLAKPVNQRSKNQYTDGYGLDRWFGQKNARIKVLDDRVQFYSGDTNYSSFLQKIENPPAIGEVCTLSFLLANNVLVTKTAALNANPSLGIIRNYNGNVFRAYGSNVEVVAYAAHGSAENPIEIIAVKYELGSVQTLAHKEGDIWVLNDPPPNQALELAKCQRYFQVFETQSARPTKALDFRPTMRTEPILSTITVGDKTLYTASANF